MIEKNKRFNNNNQQNKKFYNNSKNSSVNKRKNSFYNNKKKNYHNKYHNHKKTIEEYEKIYLEKKMKDSSEKPICPICNEPIYIVEEAIRHNKTEEFAHFECVTNQIRETNKLEKSDKLVYLGSGTFGVIEENKNGKNSKLSFKQRINYENRKVKKVYDDADPEEEELFNI